MDKKRINELIEQYVPFDEPIPYITKAKKMIYIYPVLLKNIKEFERGQGMLHIDKNATASVEIIQMSYLKYLYSLFLTFATNGEFSLLMSFQEILKICLHFDVPTQKLINFFSLDVPGAVWRRNKKNDIYLDIDGTIITSKDFDDIKRIILYQNIEDYDDRIVNNDVKELYEDYMRLKNKNAIQVPLEKKILAVMSETGYKKQEVFNLTIRDFYGLFAITVDKIDYQIKENARIQGAKFKAPPEHWIIKGKKDKYAEIFTGAKEFTDKISGMSIQR